jgi:hypothetical protein
MKILMAFIIALVVGMWIERVTAPKSGAPLDAIKAKNIAREFYKVRDAANMEAYNNDFNTANVTAITTEVASGMVRSTNDLISSQNTSVKFTPVHGDSNKTIQITIAGLSSITGAEAKVHSSISANTDFNITNASDGDGILVLNWEI